MKQILTALLSLTIASLLQAQESTAFIKAANWNEIISKAKKENKHIFVDLYATWCAPCKYMDKNIFSLAEVDNYLKENFVSVKIQMDKTKADAPEIKAWYKDAKYIEDKYAIGAFPTYMIFTPEGKAAHRIVGTAKTGPEFIGKVREGLQPQKQYYTIIAEYENHLGDSAYLKTAMQTAMAARDQKYISLIGDAYFGSLKNPFVKENLMFLRTSTTSNKHKAFALFRDQPEKVDAILGPNVAINKVNEVVFNEEIKPYDDTEEKPDWTKVRKEIREKYPMVKEKTMDMYELRYYEVKRMVPEFDRFVLVYANQYSKDFDDLAYNNLAWDVFMMTENKQVIEEAIKWAKKGVDMVDKKPGSNYVNFMDTYANLQYKSGNKEEALKWEKMALDVAKKEGNDKKATAFAATLAKMEKGENTW